ncbi:MAG: sodium:calcium antiporter, partial [Porphyromonadaceae bacterium]|nr:sodium:calcium antiporter [Porphyromonadaceae bacterium]
MLVDILLFLLGIVLIIVGANYLTEGASTLARRMGLSPLVVGLTIVAFGTSAPELIVSLMSALKGNADIAMGNVVGSNIFNLLAIGGVTAVVAPITITQSTIRREIP